MSESVTGSRREAGRQRAIQAVRSRMAEMSPPLSVTVLAARAEVKRDTIDLFLRGERWPQQAKRAAIERVLGWPVGRIDEIAASDPSGLGRSDDSGDKVSPVGPGTLVRFLESAERDLSDAQRELLEAEIRAFALRRAMEIRGEL